MKCKTVDGVTVLIGATYRTRYGRRVTIHSIDPSAGAYPVKGRYLDTGGSDAWSVDGIWNTSMKEHNNDLFAGDPAKAVKRQSVCRHPQNAGECPIPDEVWRLPCVACPYGPVE